MANKLNIPTSFMGVDSNEAYERIMNEQESERKPIVQQNFQSTSEFWTIENVSYRNEIIRVDLLKTLLDEGSSKTQDEWGEYSKTAKQAGDFYAGNFPLYHSLFASLFRLKDREEIEEIRNFLQKQFEEKWLMTLTRIKYNPKGKDEIVHDYKMPGEYSIQDNFVGQDEWVKDSRNKTNYKSLLDSDNLQEINSIYNWITGENPYSWKTNSKLKNLDERVAGFFTDTDWAVLDCHGCPSSQCSALGVRAVRHA